MSAVVVSFWATVQVLERMRDVFEATPLGRQTVVSPHISMRP